MFPFLFFENILFFVFIFILVFSFSFAFAFALQDQHIAQIVRARARKRDFDCDNSWLARNLFLRCLRARAITRTRVRAKVGLSEISHKLVRLKR